MLEGQSHFENPNAPTVDELAVMYATFFKTRLADKKHGDMMTTQGHIVTMIRQKIAFYQGSVADFIERVVFVRSTEAIGKKSMELDLKSENASTLFCILPEPLFEYCHRIQYALRKVNACICAVGHVDALAIDEQSGWIQVEDTYGLLTSESTYISADTCNVCDVEDQDAVHLVDDALDVGTHADESDADDDNDDDNNEGGGGGVEEEGTEGIEEGEGAIDGEVDDDNIDNDTQTPQPTISSRGVRYLKRRSDN